MSGVLQGESSLMPLNNREAYKAHRDWEFKRSDLSTLQKREAKGYLWGVFKEKNCFFCAMPLRSQEIYTSYTIHHEIKIGLPFCNLLINLHLAHFGCNSRAGSASTIQKQREKNKERESEVKNPTEQLREVVDYSQGSTEMQTNNLSEVPFSKWVKRELLLKGHLEYKEVLDQGAYAVGTGQQAIRRYLDKLIGGKELSCKKDAVSKKKLVKLTQKGEEAFMK